MKNVKSLLVSLLLLVTLATYAQDPNFHIYLCFGQSNMEGMGTIENQDRTVDDRFVQMYNMTCDGRTQGEWGPATPPLAGCGYLLGPTDYFGRTMVEKTSDEIKIGIIVVAVSGCGIELFMKDEYLAWIEEQKGSGFWDMLYKDRIEKLGGNPYQRLVDLAKLAQKDGVIKGILMHQGESNQDEQDWPQKVKGVYEDLLGDLNLQAENIPFLAGEVVYDGMSASHNKIIAKLPEVIPTAHVVPSEGCTKASDNIHFNSAGYRELGKRYANIMLELVDTDPKSEDQCPDDPNKTEPGVCGCNKEDIDSDKDKVFDCEDNCPNDPNKIEPGECGCNKEEGSCTELRTIELKKGWNLIGYPYKEEIAVETALSSIWENVEVIKDAEGFYSKSVDPNLNSLLTLQFAKGYFVKVKEDCILEQ